ncbi:MAG: hypothetical protein WCD63_00270, partial [Terrimicrobiaceae bacterium]
SVYHHYRWRAYLQKAAAANVDPWAGLKETDDWQQGHLRGASRTEMEFWVPGVRNATQGDAGALRVGFSLILGLEACASFPTEVW